MEIEKVTHVRDHPRECGKNPPTIENDVSDVGSPPRVREKHSLEGLDVWETRITPASAGKTCHPLSNGSSV